MKNYVCKLRKMKNIKLFSIIKICIFITTYTNSMGDNKTDSYCGYHGARCFPFQTQPCCENTDQCQYINGYYTCEEKGNLDMPCNNNWTCAQAVKNAVCDEYNRCACKDSYKAIGINQCAPALNIPCIENEPCAFSNLRCIDGFCQCVEPNFVQENSKCRKKYSDEPCETSTDCSYYFEFSNCSSEKKCICDFNHIMYNKTICVPTIEELCIENNDCSIENSICIEWTCQCKPEYFMSSKGECIAVSSMKSCYKNADCIAYKNSHCSGIGKCLCNSNYAAADENSCESHSDKQGAHIYSLRTVTPNDSNSTETLGGPCLRNSDCNDRENLICSENNVCICKSNFTSFHGNKCKVLFYGFCTNHNQCISPHSHCINNKCQCQSGYTQISTHQCINSNDTYSCFDVIDCSDPWHADCIDGKCVCRENHIALNKATCYPLLGGRCWNTVQCLATNSECFDFHCRCKRDFVQVSESTCLPKN